MWKIGKPKEDGRYFVLMEMEYPVIFNGNIGTRCIAMASNFRDGKWCGECPDMMTVTHWMEVPDLMDQTDVMDKPKNTSGCF